MACMATLILNLQFFVSGNLINYTRRHLRIAWLPSMQAGNKLPKI